MPITSTFFVRSTAILLTIATLVLIGIVATVIWLGEQNRLHFDEVIEARDARVAASDMRNALRYAESSQRGFIITGEDQYLIGYEWAKQVLPDRLTQLGAMLAKYPEATDPWAEFRQRVDGKMAEMAQTIDLVHAGRSDEAIAIVKSDRGKELMDGAVEFLTALIAAADEQVTSSIDKQRVNATWLRWVSILGGVAIIAVVGFAAITVWRYTQELQLARDEVAALNSDLEARVAERTADLARANDEIQRFAYIVTHDLRAPLVNIMGFTSELEESVRNVQAQIERSPQEDDPVAEQARLAATEDLPEAISFIRTSTRKMDGLINAILKLSREGRRVLKPERVELREVLEAGAGNIQHMLNEHGGEIHIDANVPAIRSDKLSLEQTFGNLLDNAVKYRAKDRPLRIDIRAGVLPGQRIEIEVTDNGRGIAPQDGERVFELFRRSGVQDQPGEGIGLAYVRTVVRNLGGDITMKSTFGEGTTFRVVLPRVLNGAGSTES